ncbi:MAG: adenine phosphoribosyltransferase [Vulcanimicrobiaceae bacterium]
MFHNVLSTNASTKLNEKAGAAVPRTPGAVDVKSLIRAIPDFPIPGILFRDITPLLKDAGGFKAAIDLFVDRYQGNGIDYVVGVEARGYMLGAPLAYAIGAGFVPVRKPGKLPGKKIMEEYALEYGTNSLEIHEDAVGNGKRVLIVDDLLATGGTAFATRKLLERLGAKIDGFAFLIEIGGLGGRDKLGDADVTCFITY